MRGWSVLLLVLGGVSLAEAGMLWIFYADIGFPDGHITALGRARQVLYPLSAGALVLVGGGCLVSAWRAGRGRWGLVLLWGVLHGGFVGVEGYCVSTLEDGEGG